jgi:hypothetical protein
VSAIIPRYSITGDSDNEDAKEASWVGLLGALSQMPLGMFDLPSGIKIADETGVGPGADRGILSNLLSMALGDRSCFLVMSGGIVPFIATDDEGREMTVKLAGLILGRLLRHGETVQHTVSPVVLGLLCGASPKPGYSALLYGKALYSGADVTTAPMPTRAMIETMLPFMEPPTVLLDRIVAAVGDTLSPANFQDFMSHMETSIIGPDVLGPSIAMMREGFHAGLFGAEFRGTVATDVIAELAEASVCMTHDQIAKVFGAGEVSIEELYESVEYRGGIDEKNETVLMFWEFARGLSYDDKKRLYWYASRLFFCSSFVYDPRHTSGSGPRVRQRRHWVSGRRGIACG